MSLTQQIARHRKACIGKAVDDGYFDTPNDARKYDLDDDGTFRLRSDQFVWFKVYLNIDHC